MNPTPTPPAAPTRAGRLFFLTAVGAAAFVVTTFVLTALSFGQAQSKPAQWFEAHALRILAVEVVFTLTTGFLAMTVDRRETTRRLQDEMTARLAARHSPSESADDSARTEPTRA